jgi:branched-chain amino acid transport system substrate-binding protein
MKTLARLVGAAALASLAISGATSALAQEPVKIGYAIARTGPWSAGAQVSQCGPSR